MKSKEKVKGDKTEKRMDTKGWQKEIALQHSLRKTKWIIGALTILVAAGIVLIIFFIVPKEQSNRTEIPANNNSNSVVDKPAEANSPATHAQDSPNAPEVTFNKTVHNYGALRKDADGRCEFTFTNTGTEPLILSNVKSSCGCTVPTWPKEPIQPGKSGTIKVVYDTKLIGAFEKTVTVISNAKNGTVVLTIKGDVKD
jgi:hypothetical protein